MENKFLKLYIFKTSFFIIFGLLTGFLFFNNLNLYGANLTNNYFFSDNKVEVPENVRIYLEFDSKTYRAGENITAYFCIENAGDTNFKINVGGDYRGAVRPLRFNVVAVDQFGDTASDPESEAGLFCMGGMTCWLELMAGEKKIFSLPLNRYCLFEKSGAYTISISHDLGWTESDEHKIPSAKGTIRIEYPSLEEAAEIIDRMFNNPDNNREVDTYKKNTLNPDYYTLREPIFLPYLLDYARKGDIRAITGIGSIYTKEATRALIDLLDTDDTNIITNITYQLFNRLPDPQLQNLLGVRNILFNTRDKFRQKNMEKSWDAKYANVLHKYAINFLAKQERIFLRAAAFFLQCVGTPEDIPFLITALDIAIEKSAILPFESGIYPRPRGACQELQRAAKILLLKNCAVNDNPQTPAESLLFMMKINSDSSYRPVDWEKKFAVLFQHKYAYIREHAIINFPKKNFQSFLGELNEISNDRDTDVIIEFLKFTANVNPPQFLENITNIANRVKDNEMMRYVENAISRYPGAYYKFLEILVERITEPGMDTVCFTFLRNLIENENGGRFVGAERQERFDIQQKWRDFLKTYRKKIEDGQKFNIDSGEITTDMFPGKFYVSLKNKTFWPPDRNR